MKTLFNLTLAASSVITSLNAEDRTIVLSSLLNQSARDQSYEICENVVVTADVGDQICFYDGYNNCSISYLTIPETQNPKLRFKKNGRAWGDLRKWFRGVENDPQNDGSALVDLPSVLNKHYRYIAPHSTLIVIGSPLWMSPCEQENAFNFVSKEGVVRTPELGNLAVKQDDSPFGVVGVSKRIAEDTRIHWINPLGARVFQTDLREQRIRRFWSLYIQYQSQKGAGLASFHSDWNRLKLDLADCDLEPFDDHITEAEADALNSIGTETVIREGDEHIIKTNDGGSVNLGTIFKPAVAEVFLVHDITSSMADELDRTADYISYLPDGDLTQLILYSDYHHSPFVKIHKKSRIPAEIAQSLRSIKLVSGNDNPECMEAALHKVSQMIRKSGVSQANILIFGDAPPHKQSESPYAYNATAILTKLLNAGHRVEFIQGNGDMDMSWCPAGVIVNNSLKSNQ